MPNAREKLIEIVGGVLNNLPWGEISLHTAEDIADRLIEHGFTFATDNNVGDKWISVKDRLPDTFGEYIVTVEDAFGKRYSDYADYDPYDLYWRTGLHRGVDEMVTHWMPLPEPPK